MAKNSTTTHTILRLIRCRKTNRYFTGDSWVEDWSQAKSFADHVDAASACVEHGLKDVELVLRMPESQADLFITAVR